MTSRILTELRRCVSAPVLSTREEVEMYARDFGGCKRCTPLAVASVHSEEELCRTIRFLRSEQMRMTIRAAGFSCNLRTLSDSVIIENRPSEGDMVWISDDLADFPARLRWSAAVDQLKAHRLMPPVLTHSLSPTVGGTLSAGGFGAMSIVRGAQVDQVHALRVVLPDGKAIECSLRQNAETFRLALGGMGCIGVIERATMAIKPLRPLVRLTSYRYPSFASAEEQLQTVEADYFFAESKGQGVVCHAGVSAEVHELFSNDSVVPQEFFQARSAALARPDAIHVWCDYFVDGDALRSMLEFLDARPQWEGLDRIHILAIRSPAGPTSRAFQPLKEFRGSRYFGIGVFYVTPRDDRRLLRVAQEAQRELLEECLRLGGRPYLCGAHGLDESRIAFIYGEEFEQMERMRRRLDPDGLFNRPPDPTRLSEA